MLRSDKQNERSLPLVLRYTFLFAICALAWSLPYLVLGKTFFWESTDGLDQHYLIFAYEGRWLRDIVRGSLAAGSLTIPMWDTSIGFGGDIITTMGAYLGDPLNLLSAIIPSRYAEAGFNILVIVRLYLAGISFIAYSNHRGNSEFGTLSGSILYAFSGWMLNSFRESFFVIPMIIFPLLLLGADKVAKRESPLLFIIASALFFITYFYFAYMACLLLVLYCIGVFLWDEAIKRTVAEFIKFATRCLLCVLVGMLISGVLLLPILNVMLGEGRLGLDRWVPVLYDLKYYAGFLGALFGYGTIGPDAYVGCGGVAVVASVFLFAKPGNRFLKVAFVTTTIMAAVPVVGWLMNGFGYVTNRWIWAYQLCLSMVAARMLPQMLEMKSRELRNVLIAVLGLGVLLLLFPETRTASVLCGYLLAIVFVAILTVRALMYKSNTASMQRFVAGGLIAVVCLSVIMPAFYFSSDQGKNWAAAEVDSGFALPLHEQLSPTWLVKTQKDSSLWRYDLYNVNRYRNNSMLLNVNSFDFYMSIYNGRVDEFANDLELASSRQNGMINNLDRRSYLQSAFGAKYFLINSNQTQWLPYGTEPNPVASYVVNDPRNEYGDKPKYSLYKNSLALPLAYTYNTYITEGQWKSLSALEKQDSLLRTAYLANYTGDCDNDDSTRALSESEIEYSTTKVDAGITVEDRRVVVEDPGTIHFEFSGSSESDTYVELTNLHYQGIPPEVPKNKPVFAQIMSYLRETYRYTEPKWHSIKLKASNGTQVTLDSYTNKDHMYGGKRSNLINLGYSKEPITSIDMTFPTKGIYTFDDLKILCQPMRDLQKLVEARNCYHADTQEKTNGYLTFINNDNDCILYWSIPYSAGWHASLDNSDVEIFVANDAFMAIDLPSGVHRIELTYATPLLREGLVCSIIGIIVLSLVAIGAFMANHKRNIRTK